MKPHHARLLTAAWKLPIRRLSGRTLGSGDGVFDSWYFEKEKYAIQPEGTETTYLASLYRFEKHRGANEIGYTLTAKKSWDPLAYLGKYITRNIDIPF